MNKTIVLYGKKETLETLEAIDFHVVYAQRLPEIIDQVFKAASVLAILIEITDPEQDLAILEALHANSRLISIPKLAIAAPNAQAAAITAGATELLHQPLNIIELRTRLRTLQKADYSNILGTVDTLTHDINSPVGITAYSLELALEILGEEAQVPPELEQIIYNVLVANQRLQFMINDLFDYFRLRGGRYEVVLKNVEINHIVSRAIQQAFPIANENNITLSHRTNDDEIHANTDARLLGRVLLSALDTAIKFCQPNSLIEIFSKRTDQGVQIDIIDPGQGLHPDFSADEVFQLSAQSLLREEGHRGAVAISLPFCAAAIHAMDGSISMLEDTDNCTLRIKLPLA